MMIPEPADRVLLLVEDNPADVDLVRELLEQAGARFRVERVGLVSEATRRLRSDSVDVVLLDLQLPDATGVACVRAVREVAEDVPIVVLTGTDDEPLAIACLDAGAQDYLRKGEIHRTGLCRSIEYAITRIREARRREVDDTRERYQAMSSETIATSVTGAIAGTGSVRRRYPNAFRQIASDYGVLLEDYPRRPACARAGPREEIERIVTRLGDAGGGPRDLMDVHIAALDAAAARCSNERARSLSLEGRLLALETMGMLVDYYRVGTRRSTSGKNT